MKFNCAVVAAACVFAWMNGRTACAEEPKEPPVVVEVKPKVSAPNAPKADLYKLPENPTVKSLLEFCKAIENHEPKDQAELDDMKAKAFPALKSACQQILTLEKSDQTVDGRYARRVLLLIQLNDNGDPATPAGKKLLDDFAQFLADPKYTAEDVQLAVQEIGPRLETADPKKAGEFYQTVSKLYATNADPKIAQLGKKLEGVARRLNLIGNPMELKGTKIDGKAFDIAELKGKVVLVDFWATWCHFCVEEIPNVKKNYEGYRNKGFEVVAISADDDKEAVNEFVTRNKIGWINLHDAGGKNAALEVYGIMGFPTTFLIGKDGKVRSLEARGPELAALLQKELGDPDPIKELPKAEVAKPDPLKDAIKEAIKEEK